MQIILLGTGTPVLDATREHSALALDVNGEKLLLTPGAALPGNYYLMTIEV